jgi:hypothetical protein
MMPCIVASVTSGKGNAMEASMCGFAKHADRPSIRTAARKRSIPAGSRSKNDSQSFAHTGHPAHSRAQRVEHALFALILGCVGCVWLGALLAEAVQTL